MFFLLHTLYDVIASKFPQTLIMTNKIIMNLKFQITFSSDSKMEALASEFQGNKVDIFPASCFLK